MDRPTGMVGLIAEGPKYLRVTPEQEARPQSVEELLGAARADLTGMVSMDTIVEAQREGREGRGGE